MDDKIRVLVGEPGVDGHDRGARVVAAALRAGAGSPIREIVDCRRARHAGHRAGAAQR